MSKKHHSWVEDFLRFPYTTAMPGEPVLQEVAMGSAHAFNPYDGGKIKIGPTEFQNGVAVHARSCLRVWSPEPIRRFAANVGIPWSGLERGAVRFGVKADGVPLHEPVVKKGGQEPSEINAKVEGDSTRVLDLTLDHEPENPAFNRGVWAEAFVETVSGKILRLDQIKRGIIPYPKPRYPVTFTYNGISSDELLPLWQVAEGATREENGKATRTVSWQEPGGGLKVSLDIATYADYPAVEILPWFENTSDRADTGLVENIRSIDTVFEGPLDPVECAGGGEVRGNADLRGFFRLHKNRPDQMRNDQYTLDALEVDYCNAQKLGGGEGRCSALTLPFFKVDTGRGAVVFGLGWLGQWGAELSTDGRFLSVKAGQEQTCFKLHPKEKIRQVRVLMLNWEREGAGTDTWEANSVFRQLIYRHYAATLGGKKPLPRLWVNSFAVGISCLQDTSAENENYIRAYGEKLKGIEAYVTDGGWFKGGYCKGEGNYLEFDAHRWPKGIESVMAEAKKAGLPYGLWFDVERTRMDSQIYRDHPEWCVAEPPPGRNPGYVLRWFGNPETVRGTFEQTAHYMKQEGFGFYRQDYNGAPLPFWRANDAPGRGGIHEALHVMGMLEYWGMLAEHFPGKVREECAGGGGRIDLDTVRLMHHHQKSDQWGVSHADQSALMGLSHYLPNNCFHGFYMTDNEYAFRSLMAGSMCHGVGGIVNPAFDPSLNQRLIDEYRSIRHLLTDAWFPLTLQTIAPDQWLASQYHRKDLGEGVVLAYRREDSPYNSLSVNLRWLDPAATYRLAYFSFPGNKPVEAKGSELMDNFIIEIPAKKASEILVYKRTDQ